VCQMKLVGTHRFIWHVLYNICIQLTYFQKITKIVRIKFSPLKALPKFIRLPCRVADVSYTYVLQLEIYKPNLKFAAGYNVSSFQRNIKPTTRKSHDT
jgi:hypothetical protein